MRANAAALQNRLQATGTGQSPHKTARIFGDQVGQRLSGQPHCAAAKHQITAPPCRDDLGPVSLPPGHCLGKENGSCCGWERFFGGESSKALSPLRRRPLFRYPILWFCHCPSLPNPR
jgi:hypothetical protein